AHNVWYSGQQKQLAEPDSHAFRGDIPTGQTLELLTLGQKPIPRNTQDQLPAHVQQTDHGTYTYTFTGEESYIAVADLPGIVRQALGIPSNAREKDKVYNGNFKPYDRLPATTRWSNELAALSVPKSFSSYFAGLQGKVNYSEKDILGFIDACFGNVSSPEMTHVLHANHMAWAALAYMRENGNVQGDIMTEFYTQNTPDFFLKDVGTVMPSLLYTLALLGEDPVAYVKKLDVEIWGVEEAAEYMRQFMHEKSRSAVLREI
ncbi:MAG: hypothetical protein Q7R96_05870, partial [Nanoarchaeota archaeon]|nr:hypothetical protein [Nanoarchaeota archaeon]